MLLFLATTGSGRQSDGCSGGVAALLVIFSSGSCSSVWCVYIETILLPLVTLLSQSTWAIVDLSTLAPSCLGRWEWKCKFRPLFWNTPPPPTRSRLLMILVASVSVVFGIFRLFSSISRLPRCWTGALPLLRGVEIVINPLMIPN